MNLYRNGFTVCISSVIYKENNFLDYRYIAKTVVEEFGMEAVRNPEDVHTQANFENELNENCDFFVLLLGDVPSKIVERELKIALSRGIPILVFAREDQQRRGHHLPVNIKKSLLRISPELYNTHITVYDNCEELARLLKEELQTAVFRRVKLSPLIGLDPPIAYTEGVRLIREAKYRIVLSQKTSCLILGPRKNVNDENEFYDEMIEWLKNEREQSSFFVHYFSLADTIKAMQSGEYDLEKAKQNLQELAPLFKKNNYSIRYTDQMDAVPHLIGDTGIGLNFWIGNDRYYLFLPCFLTKDSELQKIIAKVQRIGKSLSIEHIMALYDKIIK